MSVKLYKNNSSSNYIVAAAIDEDIQIKRVYKILNAQGYSCSFSEEEFEKNFTALPEAPKRCSGGWAVAMLEQGKKLSNPTRIHGNYIHKVTNEILFADGWVFREFQNYLFDETQSWQLYEEPLAIIECLPHEFVEGQEVLARKKDEDSKKWIKTTFLNYEHERKYKFGVTSTNPIFPKIYYPYCIPFVGNEHLENIATEGEYGAVPRGYIPPHTPKLGDDDYWMVGDEVVCLSNNHEDIIEEISEQAIHLQEVLDFTFNGCYPWINGGMSMRVLYHKGSYVKGDGSVHEHVPMRSYKIEEQSDEC